jgi:tyrosyl-tRNA synthetase
MKREVHPMQAKKELARRVVADFHSAEAATKSGEAWAKQFQKDEEPEDVEEIGVDIKTVMASAEDPSGVTEILESGEFRARLDRLLVAAGVADSVSDAVRKIKQRAVKVNGELKTGPVVFLEIRTPATLRVGRKIKKIRFIRQ